MIRYYQPIVVLALLALFAEVSSAQPTPGFNNKIPKSLLTPDTVKTRVGTLKFFDGIPTEETAGLLLDNLDVNRGIDTFLNGMPASNVEAARRGHVELGQKEAHQIVIFDQLMDSNSLFLTGNTDTVYITMFLDLKRDGPTIVEIPAGAGPGIIIDAFSRYITNLGPPGPDQGKGGKYLVLPPGYDESDYEHFVPQGYFIAKSRSWVDWVLLRGFLKDGKPDYSSKLFRQGMKVYPLSKAADPPEMEFINGSGKVFNTVHSSDYQFYEELHTVIDREPIEFIDPQVRGIFASIGIQKGKPFSPDERMKKLLTRAAELGNATARTLFWKERDKSAFLYEGSHWKRGFVGGSHEYLKDQGLGGRNIDARAQYFYFGTFNSPAMVWELIGKGSKYAWGYLDQHGDHLDGGKSYKLHLPKNPPAQKFISVVVYDTQTRSQLQTGQQFPSKNNVRDKDTLSFNDDGSFDLYFGPKAPKGKEANWIQTVAGKGWFCLLRLYSPTEAWYDKTWRPGEIELIETRAANADKTSAGKTSVGKTSAGDPKAGQQAAVKTRQASCNCGQLRVTVKGPDPERISLCHCNLCQKQSGSAFAIQARFPREQVTIEGKSTAWKLPLAKAKATRYRNCVSLGGGGTVPFLRGVRLNRLVYG